LANVDIAHEEGPSKGRYIHRPAGGGEEAELTYSQVGTFRIIVDHTGVPDSLRGQGIGLALAEKVVSDACERGLQIIPLCPFFRLQAERHEEWRDVVEL